MAAMKDREFAARFIELQMTSSVCKREKGGKHHYGLQDLRDLLDFIYEGPPDTDVEALRAWHWERGFVERCRDAADEMVAKVTSTAGAHVELLDDAYVPKHDDEAALIALAKEIK